MTLPLPSRFRIVSFRQRRYSLINTFYVNIQRNHNSDFSSASIAGELPSVHAYWEESLFAFAQFPKAGEINWRVLDLVERIVDDRKLIGFSNEASKRSHVEVKIKLGRHSLLCCRDPSLFVRKLILYYFFLLCEQLIYRASQKTFQSPRLLRFLFLAQVDAGLYSEADVTLQAYWNRVQTDSQDKNDTDSTLTLEQRIRQDVESEYETATVLVAGSRLYSNNLSKPAQAQLFAERSLAFIQKAPENEETKVLLHDANKYQAAALGLMASEGREA